MGNIKLYVIRSEVKATEKPGKNRYKVKNDEWRGKRKEVVAGKESDNDGRIEELSHLGASFELHNLYSISNQTSKLAGILTCYSLVYPIP